MIDKIKALGIGLIVVAIVALFVAGLFAGGAITLVFCFVATIIAAYIIGSEILELHRSNKRYKEMYHEGA